MIVSVTTITPSEDSLNDPGITVEATEMIVNATAFDNLTVETTTPARFKGFWEYDIFETAKWIYLQSWRIYAPPGILGNFIVIIVTLRMKPFNSSSLFMTSLAVVDLILICFRIPFKEIEMQSTAMCNVYWYLNNVLPVYSNYILVFWTIERFIAVQFPLKVNEWCCLRNTAFAITGVGIFASLYNIPWGLNHIKSPDRTGCDIVPEWSYFTYKIWLYIEIPIYIFIPMLTIFVCNVTIIYRLRKSTARHKEMTSSEESRKIREKEQRNLTITLLVVSFAFLILHIPAAVYNCFAFLRHEVVGEAEANWVFINTIGITMSELQNSVNFYLYFLSGRKYRRHTIQLFCPWRKTGKDDRRSDVSTKITTMSQGVSNSEKRDSTKLKNDMM